MAESGEKNQETGHSASTSVNDAHPDDREDDLEVASSRKASPPQTQLEKSFRPNFDSMKQFRSIFATRYRHCVILAIGIPVFSQLSGVNVLVSYSTKVFEDAGMNAAIVGSAVFGMANIIGSLISIWSYEKFGRVKTTRISVIIMILCYLLIALVDMAASTVSGIVSAICITVFIMVFASSCGPLNMSYAAEVVPPEIASTVLGLGQSLALVVVLILVLVFPAIFDIIGAQFSFLFFCIVCILFFIFLEFYLIETKGQAPEEIWKKSTKC